MASKVEQTLGSVSASFIYHIVGTVCITILMLFGCYGPDFIRNSTMFSGSGAIKGSFKDIPWYCYLGGAIGAIFSYYRHLLQMFYRSQ